MTKRMERIIKGLQECREKLSDLVEDIYRCDSCTGFTCDKWDSYKSRAVPVLEAFGGFLKELEEKEAKWIPVNEKLPEEMDDVQITVKQDDGKLYSCQGYLCSDKWYFSDHMYIRPTDGKVLAWAPLPEPYKPKEDNHG